MVSLFSRISVVAVAAAAFLVVALSHGVVSSTTLGAPTGPVLLTVSGSISARNVGDEAHLDLALLEHIGSETFTTTTIWTEGDQTFRGTRIADLMQALGVDTGTLRATAINNYSIEIPIEEAILNDGILAFERNGRSMSVRDKGPIWIVYPYDADPKYQSEVFYARSVWQLDRLAITR